MSDVPTVGRMPGVYFCRSTTGAGIIAALESVVVDGRRLSRRRAFSILSRAYDGDTDCRGVVELLCPDGWRMAAEHLDPPLAADNVVMADPR